MHRPLVLTGLFLALAAAPLPAAPFLTGTVTDEEGRPVVGATVKVLDCIGTCLGGVARLTDARGQYVFEEKPFRNSPLLTISMPGRYELSRASAGPALSEPDADIERRVDFVLGTPAEVWLRCEDPAPAGWTQRIQISPGRDARVHRYPFPPQRPSGDTDPLHLFPELPRNEQLHVVVVREPVVEPSDNPKETRKRQRESFRNRVEIVGPPFRLPDPQIYSIRARIVHDPMSDTDMIRIESIHDALGADRTAGLAASNPGFGPPVDADTQSKAAELLQRVAKAATPWNARPAGTISSYEYDAVAAAGESIHVRITPESPAGPAWSDIARLRGFAWMPPLRWLFSQPENVVFHGMETADGRTRLHYRLKSPRGFAVGIGVGSTWNGFIQSRFSNGVLVVDATTAAVIEHRFYNSLLGEESIETFGDIIAVGDGFAPRTLRIQTGGFDATFAFRVHKDKLWLLDTARRGSDQAPAFEIRNVALTIADEANPEN